LQSAVEDVATPIGGGNAADGSSHHTYNGFGLDGWNSGLQTIAKLSTLLSRQGIALPRLDEEVEEATSLAQALSPLLNEAVGVSSSNDEELYDYLPRSFGASTAADPLLSTLAYLRRLNTAVSVDDGRQL